MSHYKTFEEMEIYVLARKLSNDVWYLIVHTPLGNDFKLRDQINASSGSVMDNIAEGFGRGGNREFINFLSYSRGSCLETRSQIIRAYDRRHISSDAYQELHDATLNLENQISRFISYLKKSTRKGSKFD